jgi:hypothetical protein
MNSPVKHIDRQEREDGVVEDTYALCHPEALKQLTPDGKLPPFNPLPAEPDPEQWIKEMEETQKEVERVRLLNAPTVAENRRIRARNKLNKEKEIPPRLPHKVPDWAEACLKREADVRVKLKKRKPEEWFAKIKPLTGALRNRIACLVWWDFFGGRPTKDRWDHLDKWVSARVIEVPTEDIESGLRAVGYSPWEARKRADFESNGDEEEDGEGLSDD